MYQQEKAAPISSREGNALSNGSKCMLLLQRPISLFFGEQKIIIVMYNNQILSVDTFWHIFQTKMPFVAEINWLIIGCLSIS